MVVPGETSVARSAETPRPSTAARHHFVDRCPIRDRIRNEQCDNNEHSQTASGAPQDFNGLGRIEANVFTHGPHDLSLWSTAKDQAVPKCTMYIVMVCTMYTLVQRSEHRLGPGRLIWEAP